jgi:hypothetical protein
VEQQDPHGVVDSFVYGVSINRIAYPVGDSGELFVMPSGTSPIDYDELFPNPRWGRLAAGFREVGALLVLAVPADAPHLLQLVDATDGAVIVGDQAPADLSVAQAIGWLRVRRPTPPTVGRPIARAPQAPEEVDVPPPRSARRRWLAGIAGVALTAVLGGAAFWFARRPFASEVKPRRGLDAASPAAAVATGGALATDSAMHVEEARRDSIARDSAARAANLAVSTDSFPVLPIANPADSVAAAGYAVVLENTNGLAGAILDLRGRYASVPAGSYALDPRTRYYQLVAGAYQTRAGADSLLARLRTRKILAPTFGSVTALPLAFLVEADVPANQVQARLTRAAARAQPVYALRQENGVSHLYYGAYESAQQAALAVPAVRRAGLTPTLVYRIGRVD